MEASSSIRSTTGEIKTTLPGITFGSHFPRLARLAHKFSLVRSFVTGDGNHDIKPVLGADTLRANMGSLYSNIAGSSRAGTAMPTNVTLFPRSVEASAQAAVTDFGNFEGTGELSRAFAPFVPGAGADLQQDMRLNLPEGRFHNRRALLGVLDQWKHWADGSEEVRGFDASQQQAFEALHRGVFDAFDLSREDQRVVSRYDTAPLLPRDRISPKWNNRDHYATNALTLGKQLLLARRLCERGAGFVTVTTSFVWDMHADVNNAPLTRPGDCVIPSCSFAAGRWDAPRPLTRMGGVTIGVILRHCSCMEGGSKWDRSLASHPETVANRLLNRLPCRTLWPLSCIR
jgi:hypothetical protein